MGGDECVDDLMEEWTEKWMNERREGSWVMPDGWTNKTMGLVAF